MAQPYKEQLTYWEKRERAHAMRQQVQETILADKMADNLAQAKKSIEREIELFYERYASKEGITIEDAMVRIKKHDVDAFSRKAAEYVKNKDFSHEANESLRLYNATMSINRLEMLKAEINLEIAEATNANQSLMNGHLTNQAYAEYKRQAGILGETFRPNKAEVKALVNGSFNDSDTWSGDFASRLWANHEDFVNQLNVVLRRSIIQGANPTDVMFRFGKLFDRSAYEAKRLLVTEAARLQGDVQMDCYDKAGFDQYIFITEANPCKHCQAVGEGPFYVKDRCVGINMYPMHPFCKCSTAAYSSRKDMEKVVAEAKAKEYNQGMKSNGAVYGAWNDKNDPYYKERDRHAELYYKEIRNRDRVKEIARVAHNSGFSEEEIEKIYNHVFINKHYLEHSYKRFDPNYDMAESWRRLSEVGGKEIQEHDLIMLNHELLEQEFMSKGIPYEQAHEETNKIYNYQVAWIKWMLRKGDL